jgi:hypothetical protein
VVGDELHHITWENPKNLGEAHGKVSLQLIYFNSFRATGCFACLGTISLINPIFVGSTDAQPFFLD